MNVSFQKVLVVDDRDEFRNLCKIALEASGREVRTAANGAEALEALGDWPAELILLDYTMPVLDGPATFRKLREEPGTADIPVIFMTAMSDAPEIKAFKEQGLKGTIAKPFEIRSFVRSIEEILS